jgi:hypothetical protein
MLHESELRPGNFIYYNGTQVTVGNNVPGTREPASPAQNNAKASGGMINAADGIPLTEEWLRKFDLIGRDSFGNIFKKLPNAHFATFNRCMKGYQVMTNEGSKHLMFVHEYQNWWKETTGEDLIELAHMSTSP